MTGIKKKIEKILLSKTIFNLWDIPIKNSTILSGILKIFIMHYQIIYLIANFNVDVP